MELQDQGFEIDPICGMKVRPGETDLKASREGRDYYFCSEGCLKAFQELAGQPSKGRGAFRRWLDRLGRANEKSFGAKGPCCH